MAAVVHIILDRYETSQQHFSRKQKIYTSLCIARIARYFMSSPINVQLGQCGRLTKSYSFRQVINFHSKVIVVLMEGSIPPLSGGGSQGWPGEAIPIKQHVLPVEQLLHIQLDTVELSDSVNILCNYYCACDLSYFGNCYCEKKKKKISEKEED